MLHFGEQLKTVRQARGYSLEYVEYISRIKMSWLVAIEAGEFTLFPDESHAVTLAGQYAASLGISVQDAEDDFRRSFRTYRSNRMPEAAESLYREPQTPEQVFFNAIIPRNLPVLNIVAAGAFLIVVMWLGSTFIAPFVGEQVTAYLENDQARTEVQYSDNRLDKVMMSQPSRGEESMAAMNAGHNSSINSGLYSDTGLQLDLYAEQDCWIKITVDDQVDFEGIIRQGQSRKIQAVRVILLKTSSAGSLEVNFNGQSLKAIGDLNEVVEKEFR